MIKKWIQRVLNRRNFKKSLKIYMEWKQTKILPLP